LKHSAPIASPGADIQSKVEELEELNQSLRQHDKMKDDAIAHLSDQLIAITSVNGVTARKLAIFESVKYLYVFLTPVCQNPVCRVSEGMPLTKGFNY